MKFVPLSAVPTYLKQPLGEPGRGTVRNALFSISGPDILIGTYERHSAADHGGYIQDWGILAMRLSRTLPNILLESKSGTTIFGDDNPLAAPRANQSLSLEGDFDAHFTLLCPAGYETDALYILTPDLMALLIDEAHEFSVQIIDDVIVFSSPTPFDLADPQLATRLFRIIDIVGAKAASQTARYRDARSDVAGVVAAPGMRLQRRIPRWPTLALWYSMNVILGVAIAGVVLVLFFGPDWANWAAAASTF